MVIMADWEPVWHRGIDFSHSVSLINMLKWKASILPSLVISVSFSRSNEKDQMTSDVAGVVPRSNTSVVHKWCVLWKSDQQNGLHTRHSWKTVYYSGRDWGFSAIITDMFRLYISLGLIFNCMLMMMLYFWSGWFFRHLVWVWERSCFGWSYLILSGSLLAVLGCR